MSRPATLLLLGFLALCEAAWAGGDSQQQDPAARLPSGDSASEYWDATASFASGHRFYARFLITNAGPGESNAIAMGDLVLPGGQAVPFQNGRRQGRWTLSEHGRNLRIGSSRLQLAGRTRRVEIDNDKKGFLVELDFPDDGLGARVFDAQGYRVDLLQFATPVRGRVKHPGIAEPTAVSGHLTLTHTWLSRAEVDRVRRRIDVVGQGEGPAVFVSQWKGLGTSEFSWLGMRADDKLWPLNPISIQALHGVDTSGDYPIPQRLEIRGDAAHGVVTLGGNTLQRDPLRALPTAIRMVYSFRARPHRAWTDATVDVVLKPAPGRAALPLQTRGIAILNFLDAVPVTADSPR